MWAAAAIGVALGYGFYSGAITATFICIFSVTILSRLERTHKNISNVYIELTDIADTKQVIELICELENAVVSYDIVPPKSGHKSNVGIAFILYGKKYFSALKKSICEANSVAMILRDINN